MLSGCQLLFYTFRDRNVALYDIVDAHIPDQIQLSLKELSFEKDGSCSVDSESLSVFAHNNSLLHNLLKRSNSVLFLFADNPMVNLSCPIYRKTSPSPVFNLLILLLPPPTSSYLFIPSFISSCLLIPLPSSSFLLLPPCASSSYLLISPDFPLSYSFSHLLLHFWLLELSKLGKHTFCVLRMLYSINCYNVMRKAMQILDIQIHSLGCISPSSMTVKLLVNL